MRSYRYRSKELSTQYCQKKETFRCSLYFKERIGIFVLFFISESSAFFLIFQVSLFLLPSPPLSNSFARLLSFPPSLTHSLPSVSLTNFLYLLLSIFVSLPLFLSSSLIFLLYYQFLGIALSRHFRLFGGLYASDQIKCLLLHALCGTYIHSHLLFTSPLIFTTLIFIIKFLVSLSYIFFIFIKVMHAYFLISFAAPYYSNC